MKEAARKVKSAGRPQGGSLITKEQIIAVALAQIDASGLSNFSLRDVATKLNVYPAAIYWHMASKEALLAEVAGFVMDDVDLPSHSLSWQEWIAEVFRRCRRAISKHPNTAQLIGAQLVSNASLRTELIEGVLSALVNAGFSGQSLVEAYNCVIASMLGFLTMEFAPLPSENTEQWAHDLQERVNTIRPLDNPNLAGSLSLLANKAFILRWQNGAELPMNESFERHIMIFIAGLEAFARSLPSYGQTP